MTDKKTKKVVKRHIPTDEEMILGTIPEEQIVKSVSYEDVTRKYKVTATHEGATPVIVNGTVIEAFIGSYNRQAREDLKEGAKKVTTLDGDGKKAYVIEVIN